MYGYIDDLKIRVGKLEGTVDMLSHWAEAWSRRERDRRSWRKGPYAGAERKMKGNRHAVATMVAQGRADRVSVEEEWDTSGWGVPTTVGSDELLDYRSDN